MKTRFPHTLLFVFLALALLQGVAIGQAPNLSKVEQGSETARNGFRNESEVAAKFNNWQLDPDAQNWLAVLGYPLAEIVNVVATKPNAEKADVIVKIKTKNSEFSEGISIKLVSSPKGYNQIDKRWLSSYAVKWQMPKDVLEAMKHFVGEAAPIVKTRRPERTFFTEMSSDARTSVVEFFRAKKDVIVSELLAGDGNGRAAWFMVIWKPAVQKRWTLRNIDEAVKFFGEGDVAITRSGNLKIGRITMQRKGGDGGRDTAKMLQFKINPALLFGLD